MRKSIERIVSDPNICSGKPCIKGTRIPVHIILDLLAAGENFDGIKKAYPNINDDDDIKACRPLFLLQRRCPACMGYAPRAKHLEDQMLRPYGFKIFMLSSFKTQIKSHPL